MSKDMMRAFELYQPDSMENAVELLGRFGPDGWALAGGNDTLDGSRTGRSTRTRWWT
ncbi:MAG: hypothetical protein CM1200mP36_01240 [Gammaproteobacteria bacterium]|nr:MAG: hypothetical protein CM1200mP36_01240 [Gammaproteobacteria bacterium]